MINQERIEILEKIKKYESKRNFDIDPENDPPSKTLMPEEIDYLRKKWKNKFKSFIVNRGAEKAIDNLISSGQLVIKDIVGGENLKQVKGAAFITSNHFHPFENIAIYKAIQKHQPNKHKFYRVIREGNYTAPPNGFDLFFKHANTLPLSSNPRTMSKFYDALQVLSKKKSYILIYPEQYMWHNYRKPRPFKDGAFKMACKFNLPILPCFITMEEGKNLDSDGLPVQEYTIHIMKPIFKDNSLSTKENIKSMKEKNFALCKEVYEKTYGKKLEYGGKEV